MEADFAPIIKIIEEEYEIPQLQRKRRIAALLPHNYEQSKKAYPVLYLQDGQNLFDEHASNEDTPGALNSLVEKVTNLFDVGGNGVSSTMETITETAQGGVEIIGKVVTAPVKVIGNVIGEVVEVATGF